MQPVVKTTGRWLDNQPARVRAGVDLACWRPSALTAGAGLSVG
jgi:hypothetical protein